MWPFVIIAWCVVGFPLGMFVGAHIRKWGE